MPISFHFIRRNAQIPAKKIGGLRQTADRSEGIAGNHDTDRRDAVVAGLVELDRIRIRRGRGERAAGELVEGIFAQCGIVAEQNLVAGLDRKSVV